MGDEAWGTTTIPNPKDESWAVGLPDWVTEFREHQWEAVEECVDAFQRVDLVVLDAPTGSGKTLIGEMVRRVLGSKGLYICNSKSLQEQFLRDFPRASVLKGRNNYPTQHMDFPDWTAGDCQGSQCAWCDTRGTCPYSIAKVNALTSPLAVLNTSYFLHEANYKGGMSGRGFCVVDECDTLEGGLMGFVEYRVTERMVDRLNIEAPGSGVHKSTMIGWLNDALVPALVTEIEATQHNGDVRTIRWRQQCERLLGDTVRVIPELAHDNWIRDNKAYKVAVCYKPVKVGGYGEQYIWRHGRKWLCMSASVISAGEFIDSCGWTREYETVTVPMTFPVDKRRVRYAPIADMAKKHKLTSWPKVAQGIRAIIANHPGERILVHTVSYDLAKYLVGALDGCNRPVVSYSAAVDRDKVLDTFRRLEGAVLLAPSMDRGIDLRGDECRVVIVAKVPYPNLGDPQISARLREGQGWYNVQTIRTLVQMTGRGVRSSDDWCVGYVLDSQFGGVMKRRGLIPGWWREAVDMTYDYRWMLR